MKGNWSWAITEAIQVFKNAVGLALFKQKVDFAETQHVASLHEHIRHFIKNLLRQRALPPVVNRILNLADFPRTHHHTGRFGGGK